MIVLNTIIFYDNFNEVRNYCESIFLLEENDKLYVNITVNKMTDKDNIKKLDDLSLRFTRITIYYPEENLGYMNGMIAGYENFVKTFKTKPDFVIMSNTDIIYSDNIFLKKLLNASYPENVWAIGPSIYAKRRKCFDNPVSINRRTKKQIKRIICFTKIPFIRTAYVFLSEHKARLFGKKVEPTSSIVYEVHGCCFVLKGCFVDKLNEHRYGMLLYSEEAYISEELLLNNAVAYYDSNLKVVHCEHSVTGKINYGKVAKYISNSLEYILKEYYE